MGELTKTNNAGKQSPGPIYNYQDQIKYQKPPGWGFGTSEKMGSDRPKYDFYENVGFLDDPTSADLARKTRCTAPKIGTEPRMQMNILEQTPGPQYYPKERPEYKSTEKYTFGFRRGGTGALKNQISTPGAVGPGRYVPEASSNPSTKTDFPRWTLPKAGRPANDLRSVTKHQTYDTRSSIGAQCHSKNKTAPKTHFGSSGRDNASK